jgi:hypothetical protein
MVMALAFVIVIVELFARDIAIAGGVATLFAFLADVVGAAHEFYREEVIGIYFLNPTISRGGVKHGREGCKAGYNWTSSPRVRRSTMLLRKWAIIAFAVLACGALTSCRAKDVTGLWSGSMNCPDVGSTQLEAAFQQSASGITGNISWVQPTGAWSGVGNSTFIISSGIMAGDSVAIVAEQKLAGGSVTLNLTGKIDGSKISGTASVSVSSMISGSTTPGTFELTKK